MDLTPDEQRMVEASLQPTRRTSIINAADVEPRNARFLWYPYFPLGKVVIVAGAPGHGKSQFAALAGGLASRGALPGDVKDVSRVLMMCAEDDLGDTVVPRLMAINADLRQIDFINVVTDHPGGLTSEGMIQLPGDADAIHRWVREHVTARLIVMDPVASFFGRSHSTLVNQDIREAFGPMVAIAQKYGVTILIILHLNKNDSRDFVSRIAESHGFQALARSVLALGPDPDDADGARGSRKVIAVTKANLIRSGTHGIRCEVRSVTLTAGLPEPISTSELVLLGRCEYTADDLLLPEAERTTRNETGDWLAEFVGDGWAKVGDVRKAGISDGFSWRTIDKIARERKYLRAKQPGIQHGPWWIGAPGASITDIGSRAQGKGGTGSLESLGPQDPQGTQGTSYPGVPRAREGDNGSGDLDEFRKWEQRRLGEREDDDE